MLLCPARGSERVDGTNPLFRAGAEGVEEGEAIEMTITTMPARTTAPDPLEGCFAQAAHNLGDHGAGTGHECVGCGASWPCPKALAAAFILGMHATDPVMP